MQSECIRFRIDRVALCKPYRDHDPPVLRNLMVQFAPWDRATNRAGSFTFVAGKELVFHEFGRVYSTPQGTKVNGTFTYDLPAGTSILAPLDGLITRVEYQQASDDYELDIRTSQVSDWSVILDHLAGVPVKVGDTVKAGQVIGMASIGKTGYSVMPELQINEEVIDDRSTFENRLRTKVVIHCATKFVDAAIGAQVQQLMKDWETFLGRAVYPAGMPSPGCTKLTDAT